MRVIVIGLGVQGRKRLAVAGAEARHGEVQPRLHVLRIGGDFGFQRGDFIGVAAARGLRLQFQRRLDALDVAGVLDLRRQLGDELAREIVLAEGDVGAQGTGECLYMRGFLSEDFLIDRQRLVVLAFLGKRVCLD